MAYIGKSPSGTGVRSRFFYTQSSAGATSISGNDDDNRTLTFSDAEYVDVYLNGSLLAKGDYTAASNTISGLAALASGDIVEVVVYDIFTVADTVSASQGGTFSGNVTVNARLDVDNIRIDGNTISSTDTNGNVVIDANGTGHISASDHIRVTGGNDCDIEFQSGSARRKFIGGDVNDLELGTYSSSNTSRDVHMTIDSGGRVTMPSQPAFWVDQTNGANGYAATGVPSNTVIQFNGVRLNRGSHYSTSTHRFTAPVAGLYQFSFNTVFDNIGSNNVRVLEMAFVKNGSTDFGFASLCLANWNASNEHATLNMTDVQYMNANDYVEVKTRSHHDSSGGQLGIRNGRACFSGYLIG